MPCDYSKYPPDWRTKIRPRILARANNRCEACNIKNYTVGYRNFNGIFFHMDELQERVEKNHPLPQVDMSRPPTKIILTIAHLDHDPENWEVKDNRLKAMCQRCHLEYDRKHRKKDNSEQLSFKDVLNA